MRSEPTSRTLRFVTGKIAPVAAILLAVSGCGDDPDPSGEPPVLRVAPQASPLSAETASVGPAADVTSGDGRSAIDSKLAAPVDWEFTADAGLAELAGSARAYVLAADLEPNADDMARLARALGVDAEFAPNVYEAGTEWEWTNWVAGPSDGSAPSVTIGEDAMQSWWFSSGFGTGSSEPPTDLPSEKEAERSFRRLLSDLGVPSRDLLVESYVDDWSAGVWAYRLIDGVRSPLVYSATYGGGGELTFASGYLATPEEFASYDRIGTSAGLERLRGQYAAPEFAGSDDVRREKITVAIESVEEELVFLWGVDGEVYLVPGYTFVGDGDELGGPSRFTIAAIDDRYVDEVAPTDGTPIPIDGGPVTIEPVTDVPVGDGTGGESVTPPTDAEVASFVGLTEAEAEALASERGWTVRIAARDGEQFQLTMDYRPERINLTIDAGTVTAAFGG